MTPLTLSEAQVHLLFDVRNVALLRLLRQPDTPSGAAKKLGLPANTLHYRVKRLAEVGLLEVAQERGRRRTYRTVAETFRIPKGLLYSVGEALPDMLEGLLGRVHRELMAEVERFSFSIAALEEGAEDDVTFDLEKALQVSTQRLESGHYPPTVAVSSFRLSAAGYQKLTGALREVLTSTEEERGEVCTVALLVYRGRSVA